MVLNAQTHSALLDIALDLSAAMPSQRRYQRLIETVASVFPCDAAALLIVQNRALVPVALHGIAPELIGQAFEPSAHPRLERIMSSQEPVRFEYDSDLPDPFDGHLAVDIERSLDVHACIGCSLYAEGELVGVLTVDALAQGAFDQLSDELLATFSALAAVALKNANLVDALQRMGQQQQAVARELVQEARLREGEIVGDSAPIQQLKDNIARVAASQLSVLITGETGTGKELVARTLHAQSSRAQAALVHVNCAALPESVAESELFGHVKGAFTGANQARMGKFELANGGTLFLDEVGELSLAIQAKLLRALQQGEVQRVGADANVTVNVRIIAATNRDLQEEVRQGRFRADLYHRLCVYPVKVPALKEHIEDIPLLAGHFLQQAQHKLGIEQIVLHPNALKAMQEYDWPGNVRELEHLMLRAGLKARQGANGRVRIDLEHLEIAVGSTTPEQAPLSNENAVAPIAANGLRDAVDQFQCQIIANTLSKNQGNWAQTARDLQLDRGNLFRLAKRLGLKD
ncbi:nitric oxide reductase transcriptional regulator NorR [Paraferrimonas sedimenticola]|uniref:Anaerobic nitric oxide reductase transcription regulator n=1 Tax=Paraferrimonas sedimenticola TaxID=375674 RepID=A0AA37VXD1_9GAMM|nr:nitric oxide reductase transcriptional regulator NorR [Paraferrimonas sedimenticola]GLP96671.1 anaerobic nitric oxide reductase transcription regulator [Paraferrimonas sedimenticola]